MKGPVLRRLTAIAVAVIVVTSACQPSSPTVSAAPATTAETDPSTPVTTTAVSQTTVSTVTTTSVVAVSGERFVLPVGFDLQGHRGARGLKPENTLPAFETALDLMVTTLEFDLHLTADDEIVVWHDPVIDPSKCGLRSGAPSDVPDPDGADVPEHTLAVRSLTAEQLSWYECDRNPDPGRFPTQDATPTAVAGAMYSIVTVDELIDFVERYAAEGSKTENQRRAAAAVRFNMETKRKSANPGAIGDRFDGENPGLFENRVLEIIEEGGIAGRTTIQSFDIRSLLAIRTVNSTIPLAFLESNPLADLADLAAWGIAEWSPNLDIATEQRIAEAHAAGLLVKPWTIVSTDQAIALIDAGVDGLITDSPDLFSVNR
jgi:glycerophosphoryl diester phosphodiesterase